jgi:nitrogen-specific signal transduction histidine kinase/CheY-like chemotaxis protein
MAHSAPANTQGLIPNQYQQTWTRLILIALGVLYVWWHGSLFTEYQTLCLSAVSIYIIWQIYTLIHIPRRPLSTTRFLISPVLDALLIALGVILDNGQSSGIFLLYFVMIMSNGVRFGNPMLVYSQALALLSYLLTSAFTYLNPQLSLDIPLLVLQMLSLMLLPYYIYIISKHAKSSFNAKKQAQNISFGILNRSPIPIFTFQKSDDGAPRITYANTAMQDIYRDDLTNLIGEQVDIIALLEDGNEIIKACQDGLLDTRNKPSQFYVRGRNANDQKIQLMGQTSSLHLQGKTTGICFLIDITQSESIHSDMGKNMHEGHVSTLVAGIAHDFRNILTSIIGSAEVMQFTMKDQSIIDQLGLIIDAGERGSAIVSNILSQSMPAEGDRSTNNLAMCQSLTSMINLLRIQLPTHIQLQLDIEEELPSVTLNLTQLEQILMNLIKNATEAMQYSGRIDIQLRADSHHKLATQHSPALNIYIQDEGCGIAPEDIHKITKPFWTSRSKEGGTGLGLAMVQRIVRNSGGELAIQSTVGEGTQVSITFPPINNNQESFNEEPENDLDALNTPPPIKQNSSMLPWHILLVDDNPAVLSIHQNLLEHMGHKVTSVESGEHALEVYESSIKNKTSMFNLMVTDFQMGGMDGIDLSMLIRKHNAQLPILMVTAYGDADKLQQCRGLQINILNKPTSYTKLASQIISLQQY